MLLKLFLAFTLIPVAEIYLLIKIGYSIGAFNTVLVVIITAFVGATLARIQGLQTMLRIKASLQQGITPTEDLIDAFIIFLAGIVLLTPGFITDITGLLLLFPVTRYHFKRYLRSKFDEWVKNQAINIRRFPE
ncbi:MAG: FxsA family protein [Proteobacteria bacterium]|nr:FxsA family protein [Pseudomonadota bacterium]